MAEAPALLAVLEAAAEPVALPPEQEQPGKEIAAALVAARFRSLPAVAAAQALWERPLLLLLAAQAALGLYQH
jgi:hypothetical protein